MASKEHLLFLHGALGAKEQLTPLAKELEGYFHVHTINFDGHGGVAYNGDFSMPHFSENVLSYLNSHSIEQCHVFGYSMGGYVALTTASLTPKRIGKIITLGTKFDWNPESSQREARMLDPNKLLEKVPNFVDRLQSLHHPEDWKEQLLKTRDMMLALGNGKALDSKVLNEIQQQVHIMVGSKDHMVSVEESQETAIKLPHGTFEILEGVKHPIETVDPKLISEKIVRFLDSS